MTRQGRDRIGGRLRLLGATLALAWSAALFCCTPASAQFLPDDFFAQLPDPGAAAEVEADTLGYDARSDIVSAEGRVVMRYSGYTIGCDQLRYEQRSGALVCAGNVEITDASGTHYRADSIEVTDGMKEAFIRSLTLTTSDGSQVTARDARFSEELRTTLLDASYSPCGECIDGKGNRIGWKVRAAKLVQDDATKMIYFEQPSLEILGLPVAWLPWFWMPDPTSPRSNGFLLPSVDYKAELGGRLRVPYFMALGEDTDLMVAPQLMTRQGLLVAAEWQQRFDSGSFSVEASGLYQLDPGAFAGTVGDRDWRGAIQTSGRFVLPADWSAGWSYTTFTDAAYLGDYDFDKSGKVVNELFATHLSDDYFADIRMQEYLLLGDTITSANQNEQALALPNARGDGYFDLGAHGQVHLSGNLLGIARDADSAATFGAVPYVFGYEGDKLHATGEASWQNPYVGPGGIVATPFLGLRADVASYDDGALATPGEPTDELLFAATPLAAIDVRWPMMAINGTDTHLFEPIAQLVYRGSDESRPGITNDNAHSFVLDDTNLFAYNRFSGTDRQETGLRANLGARYLANFSDGSWLEFIGGQSFHLAGVNGMGVADEVNTGVSSGLGGDASYFVLGARGSPFAGATLGAELQYDPDAGRVPRAGLGADFARDGYSVGGDYVYLAADAATGVTADQHEITVRAGAPLPIDYWRVSGSVSWDIAANEWLEATGQLLYDDGYFLVGGFATATGTTHANPDSLAFGATFKLKGPGTEIGF